MKTIVVLGKKRRVYPGAKGCYFLTKEEAFHHRHGRWWQDALAEIIGRRDASYHLSEAGNYAKLPLHNKELREFLEVPGDPY